MTEVATVSSISKSPDTSAAETAEKSQKTRPEKPDEAKYKEEVAKAEKDHAVTQEKLNAVKAKLDLAKPRDKDSPTAKKQQELRAQLSAIRSQQSGFKSSRGSVQEKLASLDAQLKSCIAEHKTARSRVVFKNVEELEREIQRLEKLVETGTMKLVEERKALDEAGKLRKQKKLFIGFDEAQKGIDDVKSQISEHRKGLDNPEAKALSEKYNAIAKELDELKAEQDEAYKGINSLRDERTKLHDEQQVKWTAMREVKDRYYQAKNAYREYDQEQWKHRQEKQKAERDAYQKDKRKKIAEKKLEEASELAFMDEILTAEGLIRYFDPSTPAEAKVLRGPSGFAAEAQRTVDDSTMKGTRIGKKGDKDEMYFVGSGGKKGKKGKKANGTETSAPSTPTEGKFSISMGVIEELAKVNVEPPMNQGDVSTVIEKLKVKLSRWKADQDKTTKDNVAKAQAEIDRLEAEAQEIPAASTSRTHNTARKPAMANQAVNGHASADAELAQEKDAVADVAEELKNASVED